MKYLYFRNGFGARVEERQCNNETCYCIIITQKDEQGRDRFCETIINAPFGRVICLLEQISDLPTPRPWHQFRGLDLEL